MTPERRCAIEDCGRPTIAHGWCAKHYARWHRHGDPLALKQRAVDGGAVEHLDSLGISYRQLDYWLRTGWATIAHNGRGSGSRRRITEAEAKALRDLAAEVEAARASLKRCASGAYFAERLAVHVSGRVGETNQ